jgi:hypothetical protein
MSLWIVVGVQIALWALIVILMIQWRKSVYTAGYFRGISDELFTGGVRQRLYMTKGIVLSNKEEMQIMAQHMTQNERLQLPDEWVYWDGIDRIALFTEEV